MYKNFLVNNFGGIHLDGMNYLIYILENYNCQTLDNCYNDTAQHFNTTETNVKRSINYYIEYICKNNPINYIEKILMLKSNNNSFKTKEFILSILYVINYFDNIVCYNMGNGDTVATNKPIDETLEWYINETGEDKSQLHPTISDIDKCGCWSSNMSPEAKKRLNKFIKNGNIPNKADKDVGYFFDESTQYISLREVIRVEAMSKNSFPQIICSENW